MSMSGHCKHPPSPISHTITSALIKDAGWALYGDFWHVQLSVSLGYASTCSSLRRWIDGETPVSTYVLEKILDLLARKEEALSHHIQRLDLQLTSQLSESMSGRFEEQKNRENLQHLESIGLLLFGVMWEKALATQIGYSRWGIRAWKKGKRNTPHHLPWLLMRVVRQRESTIKAVHSRLQHALSVNLDSW